jgi:glycosyltransferase involved in cell wall biosynthesis
MDNLILLAFIVTILSAGCYTLVVAVLTHGFCKHQNKTCSKSIDCTPTVSIIIAARNESANVKVLLDSLMKQDYPSDLLEIILVDDHSTDETASIAAAYANVKLIRLAGKNLGIGKKKAISEAIRQSSGRVLLFTDADCSMGPQWVRSMVGCLHSTHTQLVCGPVVLTGNNKLFCQLQQLEFVSLMGTTMGSIGIGFPLMANGANLAVTRSAYELAEAQMVARAQASGDDMFLMLAIREIFGRKAVFFNSEQNAIINTPVKESLSEFFQQRARWVSKSAHYVQPWVLFTGAAVATLNGLLIVFFGLGFFIPVFFWGTVVLYAVKILADLPLIILANKLFGKPRLIRNYVLLQLIYPVYVVISIVAGRFFKIKWKARHIDRKGRFEPL